MGVQQYTCIHQIITSHDQILSISHLESSPRRAGPAAGIVPQNVKAVEALQVNHVINETWLVWAPVEDVTSYGKAVVTIPVQGCLEMSLIRLDLVVGFDETKFTNQIVPCVNAVALSSEPS
jgi:hypothetical protein